MISDILQFRRAEQRTLSSDRRAAKLALRPTPAPTKASDSPAKASGVQSEPSEGLETSQGDTIPLIPRDVAHLPAQRWHWSARRRMAQDHPFGRIGQMEANLELLVAELETEVDRLVARSEFLLDSNPQV